LSANDNRNGYRRLAAALVAAAAVGAGATLGLSQAFGSSSTTAAGVTVPAAQPAALSSNTLLSPVQVYSRASGGVVDISVSGTNSSGFSPFGEQQTQGEGSGFVIDTKGDIVTNQHVVDGSNSITVHFKDGTTAKATLVGADATTDIAVVRVNVSASKLHPLALGSSSGVQVGESVAAIGSPFGLPYSLTTGIVSATGRTITSPNNSTIAGAIQTDAAINHGNSGGPLIDAHGRVIGINAQIDSSSDGNNGVGFAIPIDTAKQVVSQLLTSGRVEHAFLGVRIGTQAKIASVVSGTAAAKAGLKTGDLILAVDGKQISTGEQLQSAIAAHKPGDTVTLRVRRSGSTLTLKATLGTNSP
jgi:putative serine protease PepD